MSFRTPGTASFRPSSRSGNRSENENGEGRAKGEGAGEDKRKEHSKRLRSDWLVSYESNFSVAKDREWFTSYAAFDSYVLDHKGVLMEVLGIGSVTLPVKRSTSNSFDDEDPTQSTGEVTLQQVLHVPKAVCNMVSRHDKALGRQELWTLPDEQNPSKRGVFQHQHKQRSISNIPDAGPDADADVCVYILPHSGSLCFLDLHLDSPPTGYALAPSSFTAYTDGHGNGSPKVMIDTCSGDLIPLTWPDHQRERWQRKMETGDDDSCACMAANATATATASGPRIKNSELVKKLMDQRAGLISQLRRLDELIDEVQGVTPAAAATATVNNSDATRTSTSTAASLSRVTLSVATASLKISDTTPVSTGTPSVSKVVDHSEVFHGGEDTTQKPDLVRTTVDEEAEPEPEAMAEVDAMEWEETQAEAEAMECEESTTETEPMAEVEAMEVAKEEVIKEEMVEEDTKAEDEEEVKKEETVEEEEEDEAQGETQSEEEPGGEREEEAMMKEDAKAEEEVMAKEEEETKKEEKIKEEEEVRKEAQEEKEEEKEEQVEPEPETKTEEERDQKAAYHWTSADAAESTQRPPPPRVEHDTTPAETAETKKKWVPLSTISFRIHCDPDRGKYSSTFTVDVSGEYDGKMWSYDRVKKNRLSDDEKAWLKAISRYYKPHFSQFFESLGYAPDTDTWNPETGGGKDRANARTLVKWLRAHARPPLSYGGEVMVDLDAGVPNDHGLAAAKERLRALRIAGRERSPEAREEQIFIQKTTLYLRMVGIDYSILSYTDIPDAPCWSCQDIFGEY
ncbi:hypothetical protein QBC45DRAFT_428439 [Copromyces sp. CBS 386.78]|nr:hypothetical protein QBC45DRAFT_428439 [Copromyces sp. CBS 386.78]